MSLHLLGSDEVGANLCIADDPESFMSKVVGNGQCVSLVKAAASAPASSEWTEGDRVKGNKKLKPGAAIATFQDGKYHNKTDGSSHAAIYMSQDEDGLYVIDQWKGQPAHARCIRFRGGKAAPHNDGDAYSTVLAGIDTGADCDWVEHVGDANPSDDGKSQADVLAKMKKAQKKSGSSIALVAGIVGALGLSGSIIYLLVRR